MLRGPQGEGRLEREAEGASLGSQASEPRVLHRDCAETGLGVEAACRGPGACGAPAETLQVAPWPEAGSLRSRGVGGEQRDDRGVGGEQRRWCLCAQSLLVRDRGARRAPGAVVPAAVMGSASSGKNAFTFFQRGRPSQGGPHFRGGPQWAQLKEWIGTQSPASGPLLRTGVSPGRSQGCRWELWMQPEPPRVPGGKEKLSPWPRTGFNSKAKRPGRTGWPGELGPASPGAGPGLLGQGGPFRVYLEAVFLALPGEDEPSDWFRGGILTPFCFS